VMTGPPVLRLRKSRSVSPGMPLKLPTPMICTHRRCWPAWPDLGERWPSRLVATATEDRVSFSPSSRQSFRHTLAGGISLTPLTLFAVSTFEFFSDFLNWCTHGHGRVTE